MKYKCSHMPAVSVGVSRACLSISTSFQLYIVCLCVSVVISFPGSANLQVYISVFIVAIRKNNFFYHLCPHSKAIG